MDQELKVFTGIRIQDGRCGLLAIHLDRLTVSAKALDLKLEREALEHALVEAAAAEMHRPPSHLRVTLSKDGSWEISPAQPLLPDARGLQAILWPDPVDSHDPMLRHKILPRPIYDHAVREAHSSGFIDAIFHNEQGFVTEGAVHSIFVRHGEQWRAPVVEAGLLAGTYRSYLLETMPAIREENFTVAELLAADEVWLTNALRGIRKVSIASTP